jgi:hypothetical protein
MSGRRTAGHEAIRCPGISRPFRAVQTLDEDRTSGRHIPAVLDDIGMGLLRVR